MSDWKFDLDEVGPQAEAAAEPPIEPERPELENLVPFLLGVGFAVFLFLQLL
ncbi:MAG: hypothetical protein ABEI31_02070 [Halodesulfurarchaeum sp.]